MLLPCAPDWPWQRDREDSPWYSSMRVMRMSTALAVLDAKRVG
jgi:hypothetical protein